MIDVTAAIARDGSGVPARLPMAAGLGDRVDAQRGSRRRQSWRVAACCTAGACLRPARAIAPEAPDLAAELPEASLDAAEVENGGSWSQVRLSDAALPGLAATGLSFREVALARVDLAGGRLINLAFADVELDTCNLATSTPAAARCAA